MNIIFIIIFSLVALVIFLHLLAGNEMIIERSVSINRPISQVFNYLLFVKNQDQFSVWNMTDPHMNKEFTGTDGETGFIYKWDSPTNKNVGSGEQEIIRIEENREIQYALRFTKPMKNTAESSFKLFSISSEQTNVQWGFYGKSKFPMTLMKPMISKMLTKDISTSLKNLKAKLES